MARYRKTNIEHLLEMLHWSFTGSATRAFGCAVGCAMVLCVFVPFVLAGASPNGSPFQSAFTSLAQWSTLAGALIGLCLVAAAIWKSWD